MILGTLLIAGGAVIIAVFGIVPEPTRSLEDLLELFSRPAFVAYFSILGVVVFGCLVVVRVVFSVTLHLMQTVIQTHIMEYSLSRRPRRAPRSQSPPRPSPSSLTLNTLADECPDDGPHELDATERTPLLDGKHRTTVPSAGCRQQVVAGSIDNTRLLLAISYASFSGIISGMCLLFAKSGVELLLLTFRGQNQFWRWQAWMLVLGLVVFALLQLWYLHKALILAAPTLVCPCKLHTIETMSN